MHHMQKANKATRLRSPLMQQGSPNGGRINYEEPSWTHSMISAVLSQSEMRDSTETLALYPPKSTQYIFVRHREVIRMVCSAGAEKAERAHCKSSLRSIEGVPLYLMRLPILPVIAPYFVSSRGSQSNNIKVVVDMDLMKRDIFFHAMLFALPSRAIGVRCCVMLSLACSIEQPLVRALNILAAVMKLEETPMSAGIHRITHSTDVRAPWSLQ